MAEIVCRHEPTLGPDGLKIGSPEPPWRRVDVGVERAEPLLVAATKFGAEKLVQVLAPVRPLLGEAPDHAAARLAYQGAVGVPEDQVDRLVAGVVGQRGGEPR